MGDQERYLNLDTVYHHHKSLSFIKWVDCIFGMFSNSIHSVKTCIIIGLNLAKYKVLPKKLMYNYIIYYT